jgi:putative endonuclease
MSNTVYILYSASLNHYYIGQTINLGERIAQHNTGEFVGAYTKKANDWVLYYSIGCKSLQQALSIEKHIKRMKSRKYIENLVKYPEISEKLLDQYQGSQSR